MKRAVVISYLIGFMDMFAVGLFSPLFPKYARQAGISTLNIGLFGSIYGFLQFFSSPVIGSWADGSGKGSVLIKCLLLSAVGYYILGLTNALILLFISRIIVGCFKHTQSLTKALLTDITHHSEHHEAFGYHTSISNLGFIIGPTLGGIISEYENGFHKAVLIGATLFVLEALIIFFFVDEKPESESKTQTVKKRNHGDFWKNLRMIIEKPGLREIFLIQLLLSASSMLFRENSSLLLHVRFQTSNRNIGFMISFANFVSSVSGFFVARLAKFYGNDDAKLLSHCTYFHILAVLSSTFAPEFYIYILFLVPYKLSQSVARVAVMNLMVENADGVASGELMGSSQSVLAISRILAPFVCGLLQGISVLVPGLMAGVLGVMVVPYIFTAQLKPMRRIKVE